MMKKIIITTTIPVSLGFFVGLYAKLKKHYEVCVVSSPGKCLDEIAANERINKYGIAMQREISLIKDMVSFARFIKLFVKEKPYVVHGNTPKASLLSMMAAKLTGVPHRIYMCHGLRYQGCSGYKRNLLMNMERISCACATEVICVSDGVKETLEADGICQKGKTVVIGYGSANGIDVNRYNPIFIDTAPVKETYHLKEDDFVMSFVGRIVKDKGVEELVDAFVALKQKGLPVKLLLIGGREGNLNPLCQRTEDAIRHEPDIIETGKQMDIRPFVKASKLLVLPSYREGFGLVLMEAGAMGVPVISSDIIGCNNVVIPEVNGLFCQPQSVDSLVKALERMYNDKELYTKIAAQTRQSIIDRFEQNAVQTAYLEHYINLQCEG